MVDPMNATNPGRGESKSAYYEQIRATLRAALEEKQRLDNELVSLNQDIEVLEAKYRKDTPAGNLVVGFDSYVRNVTNGTAVVGGPGAGRRKGQVAEINSFFSRVVQNPTAPKPTGSLSGAAGPTKNGTKKRKSILVPDADVDELKPSKRGKTTYIRE